MIDAEGFTNPLARAEPTSSVPVLGRHYNQNCTEYGYCALFPARGGLGREHGGVKRRKVRGKQTNTQFGRQCLTGTPHETEIYVRLQRVDVMFSIVYPDSDNELRPVQERRILYLDLADYERLR
jgi:hypothetical protein